MTPVGATIGDEVRALCDAAATLFVGTPLATEVATLRSRLEEPLRVAIAGRVKAGKSTLLNALVGERLAPTDAGECTRVVTWYRNGLAYDVHAVLRDGEIRSVPFGRTDGRLSIDISALTLANIERLVVTWPSRALEQMTLIDTPGLASLDDENSMRTRDVLSMGDDRPSDADAVIYLMRHLHRRDAELLGTFLDRRVAASSPANALGVLSRADEIGGCRLDAMASAQRIATRYQADPDIRTLCTTIVPLTGLLAETGLTLREDEAAALRALAGTPPDVLEQMLWSVDRFCDPASSIVTVELRRSLLLRFGLFGLRVSIGALRENSASTATDLSRLLVATSGLDDLRAVISDHFVPRAQVLQARSVLIGLRALTRRLEIGQPGPARQLASDIERVEATTAAFSQLRVSHLVLSGAVALTPDEQAELLRLMRPGRAMIDRLTVEADAPPKAMLAAALAGAGRWRERAAGPLNDGDLRETCEAMAHAYEAAYLELVTSSADER